MKIAREIDLGKYVTQIMKARGLSARDVAKKSGNKITAAYVNSIMKGRAANPSIDKLKALAEGLEANRNLLFDYACGEVEQLQESAQETERIHWLDFLDLMKKVFGSAQLLAISQRLVKLSPERRTVVLKYLDDLVELDNDSQQRRRSV